MRIGIQSDIHDPNADVLMAGDRVTHDGAAVSAGIAPGCAADNGLIKPTASSNNAA